MCSIVFLLLSHCSLSQNPSRPEKWWAITHPFVACKAIRLTKYALAVTDSLYKTRTLGAVIDGGKIDAFKHVYWMALLAQKMNVRKARGLGKAHEKGNYLQYKKHKLEDTALPDSMSSVMDLFNNEAGLKAGKDNKCLSRKELADLVIKKVREGEMKMIWRDAEGKFLDCQGKPIDMNLWRGKWGIPKCLVDSGR